MPHARQVSAEARLLPGHQGDGELPPKVFLAASPSDLVRKVPGHCAPQDALGPPSSSQFLVSWQPCTELHKAHIQIGVSSFNSYACRNALIPLKPDSEVRVLKSDHQFLTRRRSKSSGFEGAQLIQPFSQRDTSAQSLG